MARLVFKPKVYEKHKRMNKSPAEWRGEHKGFQIGVLPTLYSPRQVLGKDTTDGYEAQTIYHPSPSTLLQNVMPADLLRRETDEERKAKRKWLDEYRKTYDFQILKPSKTPELTEAQKLREEGKMLRIKDRLDRGGDMYKLGINRHGWNQALNCGFKTFFFTILPCLMYALQDGELFS